MNEHNQLIAEINGCISIAAKRQCGLLKMASFLEQCKSNQEYNSFEQNCSFWIKSLFQIFENHPVSLHAYLAYYCFYLITQNSKNASPDLNRLISTHFVDKAVSLLTISSDILSKGSLICLNELMSNYRQPSSQFKQKIESYVFSKLDSDSNDVIEMASICYSKLPFLHKNSNSSNQNASDMWYSYFKNVLNNANSLLNDLFEDIQSPVQLELNESGLAEEKQSSTLSTPQANSSSHMNRFNTPFFIKLTKDVDNLGVYYKRAAKRFKACCASLSCLLEPLKEPTLVKLRMLEVIKFLKRLFLFDFKRLVNDSRQNVETRYLQQILSEMFNDAMQFAVKFFKIASTNLLIQSNTISHMLAHFGHNLNEYQFLESISAFYDCLAEWIQSVGANSNFYKYSTAIIEILLNRIKPFQKYVLSIDQSKCKHKPNSQQYEVSTSSAAKKSLFEERSILNSHQQEFSSKITISSLICLQVFIEYFNSQLTYSQFEKIQETLIDIILSVQYNSNSKRPYDLSETRLGLYKNLYHLCFTKNNKVSPPISIAINVFRNGLDDASENVKSFASQSLNCLRAYTFPIKPAYLREYTIKAEAPTPQKAIEPTAITLHQPTISMVNNNELAYILSTNMFASAPDSQEATFHHNETLNQTQISQLSNLKLNGSATPSLLSNNGSLNNMPNFQMVSTSASKRKIESADLVINDEGGMAVDSKKFQHGNEAKDENYENMKRTMKLENIVAAANGKYCKNEDEESDLEDGDRNGDGDETSSRVVLQGSHDDDDDEEEEEEEIEEEKEEDEEDEDDDDDVISIGEEDEEDENDYTLEDDQEDEFDDEDDKGGFDKIYDLKKQFVEDKKKLTQKIDSADADEEDSDSDNDSNGGEEKIDIRKISYSSKVCKEDMKSEDNNANSLLSSQHTSSSSQSSTQQQLNNSMEFEQNQNEENANDLSLNESMNEINDEFKSKENVSLDESLIEPVRSENSTEKGEEENTETSVAVVKEVVQNQLDESEKQIKTEILTDQMPNLVTKKDECRTDEHDREHTSAPLQIKEIPDKNQSQNSNEHLINQKEVVQKAEEVKNEVAKYDELECKIMCATFIPIVTNNCTELIENKANQENMPN